MIKQLIFVSFLLLVALQGAICEGDDRPTVTSYSVHRVVVFVDPTVDGESKEKAPQETAAGIKSVDPNAPGIPMIFNLPQVPPAPKTTPVEPVSISTYSTFCTLLNREIVSTEIDQVVTTLTLGTSSCYEFTLTSSTSTSTATSTIVRPSVPEPTAPVSKDSPMAPPSIPSMQSGTPSSQLTLSMAVLITMALAFVVTL